MANAKNSSVAQELRERAIARLKELRETVAPHVKEEAELVSMVPDETRRFHSADEAQSEPEKPQAAQPNGSSPAPRQRRKRQGGTRAEQAVKLIEESPSTASEIAKAMKIEPNYLYRVLGDLAKEGKIVKDGRTYSVPAAA